MTPEEQADRILHQILHEELLPVHTIWRETFGTLNSEKEICGRGLRALEAALPNAAECVLHGWIDQAALEIVSVGSIAALRDEVLSYRADQGGDTGVLSMDDREITLLEFSFERGEAILRQYQQAEHLLSPD